MTLRRLCLYPLFAVSLLATSVHSYAADPTTQLGKWYSALESANANALGDMLTSDAKIMLKDLDITQDRDAFLGSMSDWALSIEGGALRHKILSASDSEAVVEVCYDFTENDILMRESFTFDGDQIQRQEQQQLANKC